MLVLQRMPPRRFLGMHVVVVSCVSAEPSPSSAAPPSAELTIREPPRPMPTGPCAGLTESACEAKEDCFPIRGATLQDEGEGQCWSAVAYVGCSVQGLCGAAMTLACNAERDPFRLPSTCMPDEFYRCWDYQSSLVFPVCASAAPPPSDTKQPVETDCERRCKHDVEEGPACASSCGACSRPSIRT